MSVWNYIGEFILFRWLFDKHVKNHNMDNYYPVDSIHCTLRRVDIEDYTAHDFDYDSRYIDVSNYGRIHIDMAVNMITKTINRMITSSTSGRL